MVHLNLDRPPTIEVDEGQDPYANPQNITATPGGHAEANQPDPAWLYDLLPTYRGQAHIRLSV